MPLRQPLKAPFYFSLFSFLALAALVLATTPLDNAGFVIIFFLLLMIFLSAAGYLLTAIRKRAVTAKDRYRIFILSLFIVVILMFRSLQSLNLVDLLILVLLVFGLLFYQGRRQD